RFKFQVLVARSATAAVPLSLGRGPTRARLYALSRGEGEARELKLGLTCPRIPMPRLILLFTCVATALTAAETPPPRADSFLIVDYLPPAVYEGDGLSACFRVENASGRSATYAMTAIALDAAGKEVQSQNGKADAAAGAFGAIKFEFDTKRAAK